MAKLYAHLKVNDSADSKQFKREQIKKKSKTDTIRNYMANSLMIKKKLMGKTPDNR